MVLYSHSWNSNDLKVHKPKILLLHGIGGTGGVWHPIATTLSHTMDVRAFDQRGHGNSIIPANNSNLLSYTPLDYGKDIIDTLDKENFYPTWILGHSMGVRSAVAAGYLKPEWLKGLILVDLGFAGLAGDSFGSSLESFLKILPLCFPSAESAKKFLRNHAPHPSIAQYLFSVAKKNIQNKITFPFDIKALIETLHAAKNFSIRPWIEELAKKNIRILILRGMQSTAWTHENFIQEKENFIHFQNLCFKEIENAGHGLPFEQRQFFISCIQEWIHA